MKHHCDRCGQGGLTMVNMTNCTNIHMRFRPVKFFFCHNSKLIKINFIIYQFYNYSLVEPEGGIEPPTPSLPRKCSTPELLWPQEVSGRRSSNPRPLAWKANALPTELLPLNIVTRGPYRHL